MFTLKAPFSPTGDQPQAIEALSSGVLEGRKSQVLLGVTGSGKTYTLGIPEVGFALEIRVHGKFTLLDKNFLKCRYVVLFIKDKHGFFIGY